MHYNEEELIRASQQGNNEAFGRLYDRHVRIIYDFVYYRTRHKETSEDLTSQTFFKALRSIGSVDPLKPFVSWLYKIAHNTVLDHYRTQKKADDIDQIFDLTDGTDIVESLDTHRETAKVKKYLESLTDIERDIVVMRVWQELPYKEIGKIVGKSEASCKMIYSRSLKKLRELL